MPQLIESHVVAWGEGLPLFGPSHLEDSSAFIRGLEQGVRDPDLGFVQGLGEMSPIDAGLLAVDIAAYAWLDDCFDMLPQRRLIAWDEVAKAGSGAAEVADIEVEGFNRLRKSFEARSSDAGAVQLWLDTGVEFLLLQERDWQRARADAPIPTWTYAEYLAEAEVNSSIKHLMSTLSLLYSLDMHRRMDGAAFRSYLRNVGVLARLLNDLASVHKERREAKPKNILLMLEEELSPDAALAFVKREVDGHQNLLIRDLERVDINDPLIRVGLLMLASIKRIYRMGRGRYAQPDPSSSPTRG